MLSAPHPPPARHSAAWSDDRRLGRAERNIARLSQSSPYWSP